MEVFQDTKATKRIFSLTKRIRAIAGGTSASKTISILVWLIDYGFTGSGGEIMTVVAESYPHLKLGAIRDFQNIMVSHGYWNDDSWNSSNHTYTFPNKNVLEFISFDKFGKAHGPRRDVLFVNECNNLPYNIVDQLITRTKKIIWLDWNPTSEFWFYTEMLPVRKDIDFITLTYQDCLNALDPNIVAEIESHKGNKNWWKVYGLGQLGELEGKIYTNWRIIDEVPKEARLERYGLDFGYSHDPATIVSVSYLNGEYILDEILYQKGMHNKDLADVIKNLDKCLTIADSAEPKSIDEIRSYGVNILGAKKKQLNYGGKKNYLNWSIDQVQTQKIAMTKKSLNLIKEYRNYMWQTDNDGKIIPVPEPGYDHCLDAVRYALISIVSLIRRKEYIDNLPHEFMGFDVERQENPAR